jgi:hypothetical protein
MSVSLTEATDRVARLLPEIERTAGYAIRNGGVGRVWVQKHYGLKESEARWVVEYFADPEKPQPEPLFTSETRYDYDAANDVYVITSRSGRAIEVEGSDIRDIRRKYSNWTGDYDTVKEIAFDYAHISLRDVKEILFAMDIIHDSSPFTDEEIEDTPREELMDELTRLEKVKVAKQWEKKRQDEQRRKAIEFDLMEIKAKKRRKGLIDDLIKVVPSVTRHDPSLLIPTKGYVVVVQPADIHFGKLGTLATTGSEYNRTVCYNTVISETDLVLARATALGTPDAIHLTVAHDWFHIDSYWKTTTKGTPQDIALLGLRAEGGDQRCPLEPRPDARRVPAGPSRSVVPQRRPSRGHYESTDAAVLPLRQHAGRHHARPRSEAGQGSVDPHGAGSTGVVGQDQVQRDIHRPHSPPQIHRGSQGHRPQGDSCVDVAVTVRD